MPHHFGRVTRNDGALFSSRIIQDNTVVGIGGLLGIDGRPINTVAVTLPMSVAFVDIITINISVNFRGTADSGNRANYRATPSTGSSPHISACRACTSVSGV